MDNEKDTEKMKSDPDFDVVKSEESPNQACCGNGTVCETEADKIEAFAGRLYEGYCRDVGGKAFNGDPLPNWFDFRGDESKVEQSNAWVSVAYAAKDELICPDSIPVTPVAQTKQFRKDLDEVLQRMKLRSTPAPAGQLNDPHVRSSRERSLAITKIQEGIMWLGMDLKAQSDEAKGRGEEGQKTPYPSSYDPSSPTIEPTADGLRL